MKINLQVLKDLDLESHPITPCQFRNRFFSSSFIFQLRNELIQKISLVAIGLDSFTSAERLSLELFDDLCGGNLIISEEESSF